MTLVNPDGGQITIVGRDGGSNQPQFKLLVQSYPNGIMHYPDYSLRGRGTSKAPDIVLVQSDGEAVCTPVKRVTGQALRGEIIRNVSQAATILTDEFSVYKGIGDHFMGGHETVNHRSKEYFRLGESGVPIHTNTAECYSSYSSSEAITEFTTR